MRKMAIAVRAFALVLAMALLLPVQVRADGSLITAFDSHSAAMFLIVPETGQILRANKSASTLYGYSVETLETMTVQGLNLLTPDQVAEERELAVKENRAFFIFRHRTAAGAVKTVHVFSVPVDYNGQQLLFSIIHDVSNQDLLADGFDHYQSRLEEMVDLQTDALGQLYLAILGLVVGGLLVSLWLVFKLRRSLRRAKEAVARTEQEAAKLDDVLQATKSGTWEWDADTKATIVSPTHAAMLGYESDYINIDMRGKFSRLIHPDDWAKVSRAFDDCLYERHDIYECEFRMQHRDGHWIWILGRGKISHRDVDGQPIGLAGTHLDITEIKQAMLALDASRLRLQNAEKVAKVGNWSLRAGDTAASWSDGMWRIFGREPVAPLEFDTFTQWVHPDDRDKIEAVIDKMTNLRPGERIDDFVYEIVLPDGLTKTVEAFIEAEFEDDKPVMFFGTLQDISRNVFADRLIRESEQRFRDFSRSSSDWFWEMDADLRFSYMSEQLEASAGFIQNNVIGKTRKEIGIQDVDAVAWQAHFDALERHEEFRDFVYSNIKDGKKVWLSISGVPLFDDGGSFLGYRGTGKNITSQVEAEQRLAAATERAEAANKAKSIFLASTSHELRTPMTTVLGFCDLLLDSDINDNTRDHVGRIRSATTSLLNIVNDILDMSKLEEGKMQMEMLDFNLHDLMHRVFHMFDGDQALENNAVKWSLTLDKDVPQFVRTDPTRLRQVLINLVGNAQKFTHHGHIDIACKIDRQQPDTPLIHVSVTDTGIGMDADTQARVFEEFQQADPSISRKYEGTGLGLTICKYLVRLMGGTIGVESEAGAGSTFWFTLPLEEAAGSDVTVESDLGPGSFVATRPLHILVAEDNKVNQLLINKVLSKFGHQITLVENGLEAVTACKDNRYDLVLMDIRMPVMGGVEATREIRQLHTDLPIVAATADALLEHIEGYLEAGMDACVSKPFNWTELLLSINTVLGEKVHVPKADDAA